MSKNRYTFIDIEQEFIMLNWKFKLLSIILFLISTATISIAQVEGLTGWNIFLDPGHSRRENMSIYGYSEAERNLRVALRIKEMLLETTDIDTVFTSRTNDNQVVDLSQRSDMANALGAAWFHSIHSNAGGADQNNTLLLWGQYYNGAEKVPNGGKAMSDIMVNNLSRGMRIPAIGSIGDCSFYTWSDWCQTSGGPYLSVNRRTTMPSELSEAGFHTNPRQNQLFMNTDWKRLEGKTYYWSILDYFGINRPSEGIVTGIISDIDSGTPLNGAVISINNVNYTTDTFESLFHNYTSDPELLHNGFYYFDNLDREPVELIITANEYYPDTILVRPSQDFFTFVDVPVISKIPPYIVSTDPGQADSNIVPWTDITINFSRKMSFSTIVGNLTISPEVNKSLFFPGNGTQLIVRMDTLLYQTNNTLTIPGTATDRYHHFLDGNGDGVGGDDFVLTFKTGSKDRTPPNVLDFFPEYNAEDIELSQLISFTFDEPINPASVNSDLFKLLEVSTGDYINFDFNTYNFNDQSVLCIFPMAPLSLNQKYNGRLSPGISDLNGNTTFRYKSLSFSTIPNQFILTLLDSFESGALGRWWQPSSSGTTSGIIADSTAISADTSFVNLSSSSTHSLKIKYGWETGAGNWLLRVYLADGSQPKNIRFDNSYKLRAFIFGDGSRNKFRFCVDDRLPATAASNHEVSSWYSIDWIGWRLVSWDLANDSTGTWLGDGNLDGILRLDSFQMTYEPGAASNGAIYIDDLQILKPIETAVNEQDPPQIAGDFLLGQCYPNPFNNNTAIPYVLNRQAGSVKIFIYNTLGQKVAAFENLATTPGQYQVNWNTDKNVTMELSSGIYYYELSVDDQKQTRKMIYLK